MPDGSAAKLESMPTAARPVPAPIRALFRLVGSLAPRATAAWIFGRMLRPARRRDSRGAAASARPLELDFEGQHLRIHAWGERGPLAVLVHGWEGSSDDLLAFVPPLRAQGWRVLALDLPAHGASPGRQTDVHRMAAALAALIEAQGPVDAMIAHSLGAAVAATCRERYAAPIHRLALIAPGGDLQAEIELIAGQLRLPPSCVSALRARARLHYACELQECATAHALTRAQAWHAASLLVVHDHGDRVVPIAVGERLAKTVGAELLATRGLGHRRILQDRDVVSAVTRFCLRPLGPR